jgi:hypothetical protein
MEKKFRSLIARLITEPSLEKMLFKDITRLCDQFLCSIREDDTDSSHVEGLDLVRDFEV